MDQQTDDVSSAQKPSNISYNRAPILFYNLLPRSDETHHDPTQTRIKAHKLQKPTSTFTDTLADSTAETLLKGYHNDIQTHQLPRAIPILQTKTNQHSHRQYQRPMPNPTREHSSNSPGPCEKHEKICETPCPDYLPTNPHRFRFPLNTEPAAISQV